MAQTRLVRRKVQRNQAMEPTRAPVSATPGRVGLELPALVLACHASAGQRARALLDGLGGPLRDEARVILKRIQDADPDTRRRAMTLAFGVRSDADQRLTLLAHEAGHVVRAELLAQLPRAHRPIFPSEARVDEAQRSPFTTRLAARLLAESMR